MIWTMTLASYAICSHAGICWKQITDFSPLSCPATLLASLSRSKSCKSQKCSCKVYVMWNRVWLVQQRHQPRSFISGKSVSEGLRILTDNMICRPNQPQTETASLSSGRVHKIKPKRERKEKKNGLTSQCRILLYSLQSTIRRIQMAIAQMARWRQKRFLQLRLQVLPILKPHDTQAGRETENNID